MRFLPLSSFVRWRVLGAARALTLLVMFVVGAVAANTIAVSAADPAVVFMDRVAKEAIAAARREVEFAYREVDIDSDAALLAAHRYDIPVIEIDGRTAFKLRVAPEALVERLRR